MAKKQSTQKLTSKQTKYLKGLGHHLSPIAMVGKEGITKNVLESVNQVLNAHELIKIKVQNNCPIDRKETAAKLSEVTGASVVQVLGKTILLYRHNPDLNTEKSIAL